MNTKIVVVQSIDALLVYYDDWLKLADNAVESNAFYEPWMLIPAIRHLSPSRGVLIVLVLEAESERLIGLFPLITVSSYRFLPVKSYECWKHTHSASATPLIEKNTEHFCFEAFMCWLDESRCRLTWVRFRMFAGNSPLSNQLIELANVQSRKIDELSVEKRALLKSDLSSQEYFKQYLSKKYVKEHRRLWNRLSEQGELNYTQFDANKDDVDSWLENFFTLEHAGWKGRAGTAIINKKNEKAFFTDLVHGAVSHNRASMSRLQLNGVTVAAECSFLSGAGGGMLKIVYDEQYAKFSPGVLLTFKKTEAILDEHGYDCFDSYAVPDHPMINKLWKQDLYVRDFSISTAHVISKLALSTITAMVALKHKIQG